MSDDDKVPLEELIAIEQVAEELWRKATDRTEIGRKGLPVLKKQAWRNRARKEVTIWRKKVSQPLRESSQTRANIDRVFHTADVESGSAHVLECGSATRDYPMESCGTI
jgi:hypothetical protein